MKNRFRASFTVLSLWAKGGYEDAVKAYFKLDRYVSPQMAEGKEYHEVWQKHITEKTCLPEVFGSRKLEKPQAELKLVVPVHDWLELVGVIDCYDRPTIYEFKTGSSKTSLDYANDFQTAVYGVLATLSGLYADRAMIYHYDQYSRKPDMSMVWLTDRLLKDGLNWIESLAGEMHHYLETNNLYQQLGG